MRVAYKPLDEKDFLKTQEYYRHNNILTLGNGIGDINIFRDRRLRKGSGVFTDLIFKYGRKLMPYLQKYLWPAAKEFGKNVAGDVISGDSTIKQSLKKRGKQTLKNVGSRILRGEGRHSIRRVGCKRSNKKGACNTTTRNKRRATIKKKVLRGGAKQKGKKRLIVKRKMKKKSRSHSLKSLDCSRPNMKKLCKKDIFS